jgi:hypothetical protein
LRYDPGTRDQHRVSRRADINTRAAAFDSQCLRRQTSMQAVKVPGAYASVCAASHEVFVLRPNIRGKQVNLKSVSLPADLDDAFENEVRHARDEFEFAQRVCDFLGLRPIGDDISVQEAIDIVCRPRGKRHAVSSGTARRCELLRAQYQAVPFADDQLDAVGLEFFGQRAERLS